MMTAELIEQELSRKAVLVGTYMALLAAGDADGAIQTVNSFADEFKMPLDEAQHEIDARVKMAEQALAPVVETISTREPKVIDIEARHTESLAKLPEQLAALVMGGSYAESRIARLFKKTGRSNTAVVVTYTDGVKRTFRAPIDTGIYAESLPEAEVEPAPLVAGPVAESQL